MNFYFTVIIHIRLSLLSFEYNAVIVCFFLRFTVRQILVIYILFNFLNVLLNHEYGFKRQFFPILFKRQQLPQYFDQFWNYSLLTFAFSRKMLFFFVKLHNSHLNAAMVQATELAVPLIIKTVVYQAQGNEAIMLWKWTGQAQLRPSG